MVERSVSHEKSRNTKPKLLRGARIVLAGLALPFITACAPKPDTFIPEPIPVSTSIPAPESSPISIPIPQEHSFQDIIVLDKEGFPVEYLLADGKMSPFNISEVKEIKQKAIDSGEPQIIAMFSHEDISNSFDPRYPTFSKEQHPTLLNLPEDVLSEEELAANGVKIIQANDTNLSIRKGAFEKGGPLEELARQHGSEKLTIVLVDGPVVARGFMKDKKYDEVRDLLQASQDNMEAYRLEETKRYENELESFRKMILGNKELADYKELNSSHILKLKAAIYANEKGIITENQLLVQKSLELSKSMGLYYSGLNSKAWNPSEVWEDGGYLYRDRTIFVAVGRENEVGLMKKVVYFDPTGKLSSTPLRLGNPNLVGLDSRPNSSRSYPNPKDFSLNLNASPNDPKSYLYGGFNGPGFNISHELEHDVLIAQASNEGKQPNSSEYDADMGAGRRLIDAWEKWEKSGYTDNSGYYFVFSLPKGQGGGYILTKAQDKSTKTAEKA